ncbi:MAG: nitroreductase family protein [Methanobacteriota archaeon]|nr:MAG: nitroreductase family protein [Euryarchaeota archaeon]
MDLFKAIRERRSIRAYSSEPVDEEDLKLILEMAVWAPSAGNLQTWEYFLVSDLETKRRLAEAALGQGFIAEAPIVLVGCANLRRARSYGERGMSLYCLQDVAASIQNILLSAYALGYGTCWVGAFREEEVSRILGLEKHLRPVAIIPLGKPAEQPGPPPRMSPDKVVHRKS